MRLFRGRRSAFAGRQCECPEWPSCKLFVTLGCVSSLIYAAITWLSGRFAPGPPEQTRPILLVLMLLGIAFGAYLLALREAIRLSDRRGVLPVIVLFAAGFRLLLLFSEPIQEIDLYRYAWDGRALAAGVSPYQYSPAQVLAASSSQPLQPDLARLVELRESSGPLRTILSRVHFAELTTPYPPVSQAVFALAALTTSFQAPVSAQLLVIKTWIVLFDLATIAVLAGLLRWLQWPVGWTLSYAWCPLVLKEFANSGHLDAIAVCLTTLAVWFAARATAGRPDVAIGSLPVPQFNSRSPRLPPDSTGWQTVESTDHEVDSLRFCWMLLAAGSLALAIGAKLYAVVLLPLFALAAMRRFGLLRSVVSVLAVVVPAVSICWPMLATPTEANWSAHDEPELPLDSVSDSRQHTLQASKAASGLRAFLSRWEMNDFLSLVLVENLRPFDEIPAERRPWFVVTSEDLRRSLAAGSVQILNVPPRQATFLAARFVTAVFFVGLALWFAWRGSRSGDPIEFLRAAFLTLAWFWLLSPTQNPWYWIWALPLVPFARSRAWIATSGLVLLYYLRFWLAYQWPDSPVPASRYSGELFFDYVVTWLEFGPWLAWLSVEGSIRRASR